ncbi:helix-turn-helix domain-containing protein [Lapidilactobacillus wuchangensis]|uniref:helix-turn-helix domain-containing protein n=1 Tax=Lapidilactobacillus wuchangensis TaxID=2486001 RepID=UPI000F769FB1|nr:helix-turn-helix transcriptional regulator [Lapidilactobacillus wuchangensis]
MNLASTISENRQQLHWSQIELAAKLQLPVKTIISWETGTSLPTIAELILLSDLFHLSLDTLVKGDPEVKQHLLTAGRSFDWRLIGLIMALFWGLLVPLLMILKYTFRMF